MTISIPSDLIGGDRRLAGPHWPPGRRLARRLDATGPSSVYLGKWVPLGHFTLALTAGGRGPRDGAGPLSFHSARIE